MIDTSPKPLTEQLMDKIKEVYLSESKLIVERHKQEMAKELDGLMDELVIRAGLRIEQRIRLDDLTNMIQITIIKDNKQNK